MIDCTVGLRAKRSPQAPPATNGLRTPTLLARPRSEHGSRLNVAHTGAHADPRSAGNSGHTTLASRLLTTMYPHGPGRAACGTLGAGNLCNGLRAPTLPTQARSDRTLLALPFLAPCSRLIDRPGLKPRPTQAPPSSSTLPPVLDHRRTPALWKRGAIAQRPYMQIPPPVKQTYPGLAVALTPTPAPRLIAMHSILPTALFTPPVNYDG